MHIASTKNIRVNLCEPVMHRSDGGKLCIILSPNQASDIGHLIDDLKTSVQAVCISFEENISPYFHDTAITILAQESKFQVVCVRSERPIIWMKPSVARACSSALLDGYWNGTIDSVLDALLSNRTYSALELFGELGDGPQSGSDVAVSPRVLFFSPYGSWLVHNQVDAVIGAALKLRGAEVRVVRCDGLFGHDCYVLTHSEEKERDCANCVASGDGFFKSFGLPTIQLRECLLDGISEAIMAWVNSLTVEELPTCEYKDYPVGRVVAPQVCSRFRITPASLGTSRVEKIYRSMILNSVLTYEACTEVYKSWEPTQVVMFNGGGFAQGAAYHVAKSLGISVLTHERGFSDDTFLMVADAMCSNPIPQVHVAYEWSKVPVNQAEFNRIADFFDNRERGKDINFRPFYEFQTDHSRVREVLRIPKDARIVSVFTSSAYELFYWPAYKKVERQVEMIDALIELFRSRSDYLVIRHHPAMSGNFGGPPEYGFLSDAYKQALNLPDNVRIIMPNEELTSYALIWNSSACIAAMSTVAIEATARGVPTAVMDVSPLRMAVAEVLVELTEAEIEAVVERLLNRSEADRRKELQRLYRVVNGMYFKYSNKFASFGIDTAINGPSIRVSSIDQLAEGHDDGLDRVCNHILNGTSVYNLPQKRESRNEDEERRLIDEKFSEIQSYQAKLDETIQVSEECCRIVTYIPGPLTDNSVMMRSLVGQRLKVGLAFELPQAVRTAGDLKRAVEHCGAEFVFFPSEQIQYDSAFLSASQDILTANNSLDGVLYGAWIQEKKRIDGFIFGKHSVAAGFMTLEARGFNLAEAVSLCVFRASFIADWANSVTETTGVLSLLQQCFESDRFQRSMIPLGVLHCEPPSLGIHDFSALDTQFSRGPLLDYNSAFQQWVAGTIKEIEDSVQLLVVGDFGQAKEKLAGVVAGRPDVPALYYLMAVADFQLGNVREAKQLVQMFLRRDPLNQEGIRLLNAIQLGS